MGIPIHLSGFTRFIAFVLLAQPELIFTSTLFFPLLVSNLPDMVINGQLYLIYLIAIAGEMYCTEPEAIAEFSEVKKETVQILEERPYTLTIELITAGVF